MIEGSIRSALGHTLESSGFEVGALGRALGEFMVIGLGGLSFEVTLVEAMIDRLDALS